MNPIGVIQLCRTAATIVLDCTEQRTPNAMLDSKATDAPSDQGPESNCDSRLETAGSVGVTD